MADLHSARPRVSLPRQLANFTNSTAGLDLTLRLIQALAQIAAEICIDHATVMGCVTAKSQLALGESIVYSTFKQVIGHSCTPISFWRLTINT
jgi:hypothetical protein